MERRVSNVDASAIRAARRRSAVTIVAPGEEPNPFQPDTNQPAAAKTAAPVSDRFADFKANPRDEAGVNAAPAPASRGPPLPPPLSVAATSTPAPVGQAGPLIQTPERNVNAPSSATNRMRGLHMFPNTPPASTTNNVMPVPRPLSFRNGNVLVASAAARAAQFPANPNTRGNGTVPITHGDMNTARPPVRTYGKIPAAVQNRSGSSPQRATVVSPGPTTPANKRGQTPPAHTRSATPRGGVEIAANTSQNNSSSYPRAGTYNANMNTNDVPPYILAARRGPTPLPPPQQLQQPPPVQSGAKWTAAARRQPLNSSSPNVKATTYVNNATSIKAARRATVPQATPSQQRVEVVRVPHPPSRRASVTDNDNGSSGDADNLSAPEAPSLLLSTVTSGSSIKSSGSSRNGSFRHLSDDQREPSIVIEDRMIGSTDGASTSSREKVREESPPADNGAFLKPSRKHRAAEIDMAPMSPQAKRTHTPRSDDASTEESGTTSGSEESEGEGEDDDDDEEKEEKGSSADSERESAEEVSSPLGIHSPRQRMPPPDSDTSSVLQSPMYFSPLLERRKQPEQRAPTKKPTEWTRQQKSEVPAEKSASSLAEFGLSSNDTLEPVSFATTSLSSGPAVNRQRKTHPSIRLPSPVDLNTVLFRGVKKDPSMASPLLGTAKHRASVGHSHGGSNNKNGGDNARGRNDTRQSDALAEEVSSIASFPTPSASAVAKSASGENWNFDYLARNGLSDDTQGSGADVCVSPRLSTAFSSATAATARSPTASAAKANKPAEEKWRVTQSLSINAAEFSFDHLPIAQQHSNVAKLRKVFESQRKSKKAEEGSAVTSGRSTIGSRSATMPPAHGDSPKKATAPAAKPREQALAASAGSTVIAPRSEPSSQSNIDAGEALGQSAMLRFSATAPSMDFSFDHLTPPITPAAKMTFPPIESSSHPTTSSRVKGAKSDVSEGEFHFSWGGGTDVASPLSRHSAPSGTSVSKNASGRLPSISLPVSEGGFSLARFENSNASADTVNMFDRYDF